MCDAVEDLLDETHLSFTVSRVKHGALHGDKTVDVFVARVREADRVGTLTRDVGLYPQQNTAESVSFDFSRIHIFGGMNNEVHSVDDVASKIIQEF